MKSKPYVIAEIGNNHQGNFAKALQLVDAAIASGADAVKFQTRNNKLLFTEKFYNSAYGGDHSFANTYGSHREAVELKRPQLLEIREYVNTKYPGKSIFSTPFEEDSLDFLLTNGFGEVKIASADIHHSPMLRILRGAPSVRVFLSTGGATMDDIQRALDDIGTPSRVVVLHCTAAYPAPIETMNLAVIPSMIKKFGSLVHGVGLSDHENGIDAGPIAYMLGARYFEKHFTLDRSMKGTDQAFSLEPTGLQKFVRNLNRIELMIGTDNKKQLDVEHAPLHKMVKSIVAKNDLPAGHRLTADDFAYKAPREGLPPSRFEELVGKILVKNLVAEELITLDILA